MVETCQAERGTLAVCIREAQRTLAQSSKRLIESKIAGLGLGHGFKAYSDKIKTPGDGIIIFAGFTVEPPVKNKGKGAAMMRIEALRRLGPQLWFNEASTEAGRDALGFYHEKKDDVRNVGLGPEHDWSSHAADALGLMAICWEEPGRAAGFNRPIRYREQGWV